MIPREPPNFGEKTIFLIDYSGESNILRNSTSPLNLTIPNNFDQSPEHLESNARISSRFFSSPECLPTGFRLQILLAIVPPLLLN
jgi:hypothetical protein